MKLTPRMLLFVLGIPAGYLPLLAAVESGPAEVGAALFLLTAFACLECQLGRRLDDGRRWPRALYRAARVSSAFAVCLAVAGLIASMIEEPNGPTQCQRLLFGGLGGYLGEISFAGTVANFRLAALWLCALLSWGLALAVAADCRTALWLALGNTPLVCGGFWFATAEWIPSTSGS